MVKKEKKVIRYSEFYVNIGYNLLPIPNELALSVQWYSIFFEQSVQRVLAICFTKSFGEKQPHNVVTGASFCYKRKAKKGP